VVQAFDAFIMGLTATRVAEICVEAAEGSTQVIDKKKNEIVKLFLKM